MLKPVSVANSVTTPGDNPYLVARLRALPWSVRVLAAVIMTALGVLVISVHSGVPLPSGYHSFADRRAFWGVPNTLDVLSNFMFVLAGVAGLILLGRMTGAFRQELERLPYLLFFVGVTLTGFGSGFYHLAPSDARLVLDLLPMTVCFVSLVAAVIMERISIRIGAVLCGPLVLLGMAGVLYWWKGAAAGHGDIRFYLFTQIFSPVIILVIILLFPPAYTGTGNLALAFGLYVAAKACEALDQRIFAETRTLSGHALKHLIAGLACLCIARMLRTRGRHPA